MFTGVALMGSYLNVCSIVDETVSEGLEGVALLEVSHWEWALRIQKLIPCFPTTHSASNWWLKCEPSVTASAPCFSACCYVLQHDGHELTL